MGMYTLHKDFWEDTYIFSGFHTSFMWPPTVYELVWPQGLLGWPPDHMGWFALLLLVKFKIPGWFYFISYSYQVVHFGGWEHCVKVWWVKIQSQQTPFLSGASSWGYDLFCGWSETLMKRGLWSRLLITQLLHLYLHSSNKAASLK